MVPETDSYRGKRVKIEFPYFNFEGDVIEQEVATDGDNLTITKIVDHTGGKDRPLDVPKRLVKITRDVRVEVIG